MHYPPLRCLPQWPGAPAGSACALPHVFRRHLIDLFGPAPLQRVAHVELQPSDPVDVNDSMFAVLEWPDALVIRSQEEDVARLQRDHRAHPRQTLFDGVGNVTHGIVVAELTIDPHTHLELMRVRDLVPGRDARPDRGERVKRLAELLA